MINVSKTHKFHTLKLSTTDVALLSLACSRLAERNDVDSYLRSEVKRIQSILDGHLQHDEEDQACHKAA